MLGVEFEAGAGAFGNAGTTVRGVIVGARTFGCGALLALRARWLNSRAAAATSKAMKIIARMPT